MASPRPLITVTAAAASLAVLMVATTTGDTSAAEGIQGAGSSVHVPRSSGTTVLPQWQIRNTWRGSDISTALQLVDHFIVVIRTHDTWADFWEKTLGSRMPRALDVTREMGILYIGPDSNNAPEISGIFPHAGHLDVDVAFLRCNANCGRPWTMVTVAQTESRFFFTSVNQWGN